jgi:lycopene beta-cyclase
LGAGAAGLSLADRFASPELSHYKVLVIDKDEKVVNDHTWCSWVKGNNRYDDIAKKTWNTLNVFSKDGKLIVLDKEPYRYRMIVASDFYKVIKSRIATFHNVTLKQEQFLEIKEDKDLVTITTDKGHYTANHVFKSFVDVNIDKSKCLYVDQHFKGWFVETEQDFFDDQACHFMDFRVDQKGEVRFMYVLPFSKKKALVELAIFSNEILSQEDYDAIINKYVDEELKITAYKIEETEFGIIPMTTFDFTKYDSDRVTNIGTMAGAVKPSSGYAFKRIQDHLDGVVECISKNENPRKAQKVFERKYKLYDATMLDVLLNKNYSGADFFYKLFIDNSTEVVFKFLDEKTSLWEEIKFMNTINGKHKFASSLLKALV